MTHELALFAGSAAAAIFLISQLPMVIKACRTKDLSSYSLANISLANLGNILYAAYIVQVPPGPAWAIHGFNLTTSALMLVWYLRYGRRGKAHRATSAQPDAPADRSLVGIGTDISDVAGTGHLPVEVGTDRTRPPK